MDYGAHRVRETFDVHAASATLRAFRASWTRLVSDISIDRYDQQLLAALQRGGNTTDTTLGEFTWPGRGRVTR